MQVTIAVEEKVGVGVGEKQGEERWKWCGWRLGVGVGESEGKEGGE
jgi:hypothetical protein